MRENRLEQFQLDFPSDVATLLNIFQKTDSIISNSVVQLTLWFRKEVNVIMR